MASSTEDEVEGFAVVAVVGVVGVAVVGAAVVVEEATVDDVVVDDDDDNVDIDVDSDVELDVGADVDVMPGDETESGDRPVSPASTISTPGSAAPSPGIETVVELAPASWASIGSTLP